MRLLEAFQKHFPGVTPLSKIGSTGGVGRLLDKRKGNGPASKLTPEMEAGMRKELAKGKCRTARDAWNWLSENHDVSDLKESVIYKYLGKCEGRLKATRPCNPKKDQAQEDAFRVELADKMQSLEIPSDKNVRLWVYDEMRYGLLPLTRKCGVYEEFGRFLHPE